MDLLSFVVVLFIANSRHFAQGKGEYVLQTLIRQALYGYIFVYVFYLLIPLMVHRLYANQNVKST